MATKKTSAVPAVKDAIVIKLTAAQKKAIKEKLNVDANEVELKEGDFKLKRKVGVNPYD